MKGEGNKAVQGCPVVYRGYTAVQGVSYLRMIILSSVEQTEIA